MSSLWDALFSENKLKHDFWVSVSTATYLIQYTTYDSCGRFLYIMRRWPGTSWGRAVYRARICRVVHVAKITCVPRALANSIFVGITWPCLGGARKFYRAFHLKPRFVLQKHIRSSQMLLLVASMVYKSATGCATCNVDCVATNELVLNFTQGGGSLLFLGLVQSAHSCTRSLDRRGRYWIPISYLIYQFSLWKIRNLTPITIPEC